MEGIIYLDQMLQKRATKTQKTHFWTIAHAKNIFIGIVKKNFWHLNFRKSQTFQKCWNKKIGFLRPFVWLFPDLQISYQKSCFVDKRFLFKNMSLEGITYLDQMLQKRATKTQNTHFWTIAHSYIFSLELYRKFFS